VAINGYIRSYDRLYKQKCSRSLSRTFENELNCDCPGGCHRNIRCYLHIKDANSQYIDVCDHLPIRLPKMEDQKLLLLRGQSMTRWARERVALSFAYKGSQYCNYI